MSGRAFHGTRALLRTKRRLVLRAVVWTGHVWLIRELDGALRDPFAGR